MEKTKERILKRLENEGIVCPDPIIWNDFYELIVREKDKSERPALPMVLTGWWVSGKDEKHQRFCEHIQWAEDNGVIENAYDFINQVELDDWYYFSNQKKEFLQMRERDRRDFISYFSKEFSELTEKIKESKKDTINQTLSLWMSLCSSNLELEEMEIMNERLHLKLILGQYYDHNPYPLSIEQIYSIVEYYALNRPNRLHPVEDKDNSITTTLNESDSKILSQKVDHIISEFMDEYIIIGKKAGRNQKMLLIGAQEKGLISDIRKVCLQWAHSRGDFA